MKQIRHLILLALACFCCALQAWAGYSGTPTEPVQISAENYSSYGFTASNYSAFVGYYGISNAEELYGFAAKVNGGSTSINGVLTADIVVNDSVLKADGSLIDGADTALVAWTPIGTESYKYAGIFDGNGHTVSGLYFNNTNTSYVGLFGFITGGTIRSVGVVDSYFKGYWYVGGIAGKLQDGTSTISNCFNEASIYAAHGSYAFAGGIAGHAYGSTSTITNCYNKGKISTKGQYTGGICGILESSASLSNCFNVGSVTSSTTSYLASIAPRWSNAGVVTNSYYLAGTCAVAGNGTSATAEEFASGRVTYLLNGSKSDSTVVWRQNLSGTVDALPIYDTTHAIVYLAAPCPVYSNTTENEHGTCNVLGQCPDCGKYLTAPLYVETAAIADSLGLDEKYVGYYAISNAAHLYGFADMVNSGSTSIKGVLLNDITINDNVIDDEGSLVAADSSFSPWTPIGTSSYKYAGTFDGNGKTISGLYFKNTEANYVGLFGYVYNPTIKNVSLVDSYIEGNKYVGGICGYIYGAAKITNCHNWATVCSSSVENSEIGVGGICGDMVSSSAEIDGCTNAGIISTARRSAGGICGFIEYGKITNSHNSGKVYSDANNNTSNSSYVGGIAGYIINSALIRNSYNTADVEAKGNYAGGVVGYMSSSSNNVTNCYNTGDIKANQYAGGIIGYQNYGATAKCFNTGTITANSNAKGIAGYWSNGTITNSYVLSGSAPELNSNTSFVTADELASGSIAFALNGSTSAGTLAWHQTLGTDSLPVLDATHAVVYCSEPCAVEYGNSTIDKPHTYNAFGQCTVCGEYLPAVYVAGTQIADSLGLNSSFVGYYAIEVPGNLYWFAQRVNEGNTSYNAVLAADIMVNDSVLLDDGSLKGDGSNFRTWTPIGSSSYFYNGTFDGNGHTISGLYYNNISNSYKGLFGYTNSGSVIKNVELVDSYIKGYQYVGGIVGYSKGSVTNCYSAASVSGSNSNIGGIVGWQDHGSATYCHNTGSVTGTSSSSSYSVGGIVGYQYYGTVANCYNIGKVYTPAYQAGGICGCVGYGTLTGCYNTGTVKADGNYVGGVSGNSSGATITSCVYLAGSAVDGDDVAQNGVGNGTSGSAISDIKGATLAVTAAELTGGKAAYALNGRTSTGSLVWYQTIGTDSVPVWDNTHSVVYVSSPCASSYSNTSGVEKQHAACNSLGQCPNCSEYLTTPFFISTAFKADSLGLDDSYVGFYAIENAAQLYGFAQIVNDGATSAKAVLLADIAVNDNVLNAEGALIDADSTLTVWTPMGSSNSQYAGTFDGNGHTISGLFFADGSLSNIGLFGYVSNPTIKNVNIEDSYFEGKQYVGGIVGRIYGGAQISNCHNAATVYSAYIDINYVGGIVGYVNNTYAVINNCTNTGFVSAYACYVGGICGCISSGTVSSGVNSGKIYSNSYNSTSNAAYAGGIAGYLSSNAKINGCRNAADVEGKGSYVGGIVGYMDNNSTNQITKSYNTGNVKAYQYAGGIVGYRYNGSITYCYNIGIVTANNYAGGIGLYNNGSSNNNFALSGTATAVGCGTFATLNEFKSGKITYQLNGCTSTGTLAWFQTLGEDNYPLLDNTRDTVYQTSPCPYSNVNSGTREHSYNANGLCEVCGVGEAPALVDGWYEIANAGNLFWFAKTVNSYADSAAIKGKLVADIVVNSNVIDDEGNLNTGDFAEWTPIGTSSIKYVGTFDGQGHTISGLYFNRTANSDYPSGGNRIGLFGYINTGANIMNVGLVDSYFKGYSWVGGICGYNSYGSITNCNNAATVIAILSGSSSCRAGGICGYQYYATVTKCYNTGSITGSGNNVGGICGYKDYGSITYCYNTGSVKSNFNNVGGVCGYNNYGTITGSFNTGAVTGSSNIGGIYGSNSGTSTSNYVLSGSASSSNGGTFATAAEFASGKIAYLLNDSKSDSTAVWRQTLGTDLLPVLDTAHSKVYTSAPCPYTNDTTGVREHSFGADGFCAICHVSSVPALVDGWYEIANAGHLFWFAETVNTYADSASIKGKLVADIVVNDSVLNADATLKGKPAVVWTPIGTSSKPYNGTFDGQGHTISGLYFNNTSSSNYPSGGVCVGLFGYVSSTTIKNVGVVDSYIKGYSFIGGITGYIYGAARITNCYNEATVYASSNSSSNAGGICGYMNSSSAVIDSCHNSGYISGYYQVVGGICGYQYYGTITNSYNTGKVYSNTAGSTGNYAYVGGISGYINSSVTIDKCYNTGDVEARGYYAGGITGYMSNNSYNKITNCFSTGSISASNYAGGIYGYRSNGTCTNNYVLSGSVSSSNGGTFATAEEFANGKVAYMLNGSTSTGTLSWFQTIGTDSLPVRDTTHGVVYIASPCAVYSNVAEKEHSTCNVLGQCPDCGHYLTAPLYVETAAIADSLGLSVDYVGFYAIENAAQLYGFAQMVNNGSTSIKGVLTDDIVVNDSVLTEDGALKGTPDFDWMTIGTENYKYAGTFDGNGNTVSGLYFNNIDAQCVGLFGYVTDGTTITNVGVVDSYFKAKCYVGGVCGYAGGSTQIANCYNEATVYGSNTGSACAGGICGYMNNTSSEIKDCYNAGFISAYNKIVGGICGYQSNGKITHSYNMGKIYADASNNSSNVASVGGVAGFLDNSASVENCYNNGDVEGKGMYAGGIVGYMNTTNNKVTGCYNIKTIKGGDFERGIVGYINNTGAITTNNFALTGTASAVNGGEFATADEFANGSIAFALNGNTSTGTLVWFQTIGTDSLPVWDNTHGIVYAAEPCHSAFANSVVGGKPHTFNTFGQCTVCGEYMSATFVADATVAGSLGLSEDYVGFYAISKPGQLYWFADTVNAGFTAAKGVLLNNIVVNDSVLRADGSLIGADSTLRVWTPVGTYSFSYVGTFDGNGYTVSGLYYNNTGTSYVGLFGYVSNSTIKNVGLVDSYIKGNQLVGGIVGYVNGGAQITNCHNAATVYANSSDSYAGGICGFLGSSSASVDGCHNIGYVSAYGHYVGGICGYFNYGTIKNSYNAGRVYSSAGNYTTNSAYAGGIAGYMNYSSSIANCYNTGDVEGYGYYAGGIAGYMYSSNNQVTNCYNLGNVSAYQYAGGICGYERYGTISKCFSAGNVAGNSYVGGIYGSRSNGSNNNNFVLSGSAANSYGGAFATADEFASGKIAYALNGNISNGTLTWFQTIGTDSLPVFDTAHAVVYISEPCQVLYGNTVIDNPHTFDTFGKCTVCGEYMPATLVADAVMADSLGLSDDYVGFYAIENAANLYWFASRVNSGSTAIKGVLLNNIVVNDSVLRADGSLIGDYSTLRVWTPIGAGSFAYYGTFDGNGHTISGLYLNNTGYSQIGLFGYVSSPTIKNVGLVDSYIKGNQEVGGIAGYVSSSAHITNCYNAATVYASGNSSSNAGGICGYLSNSSAVIDGCHNTGYVSGYYQYVGGICGYQNYGTITNSYNTGKVYSSAGNSTSNNAYVGGISGYMNTASITNCYNTGDVESRGYCAGGIVGYMSNNSGNTVTNCFNLESVKANQFAGGISGYQYNGKTSNCYNAGVITANNYAKGISGNLLSGNITNCYVLSSSAPELNNGTLFSTADEFASGLIAFQLNNSINGAATWHQNLSGTIDSLPVLDNSHGVIWMGCDSVFVNDLADAPHTFVNGVCSVCGTKEFPMLVDGWYEIENKHQLYWFAEQVNSGKTTINGKLVADIVVNDSVLRADGSLIGADSILRVWTPMGTSSYAYAGTFDGQGHTISGLYFNNTNTSNVGLFGYVNNSTIKNVGLVDSYMKGYQYVGGICGYNVYGKILNCYNSATVYASNNGDSNAGGICGGMSNSSSLISNCHNDGNISGYYRCVAGICGGQWNGTITYCYNTGKIYANANNSTANYSYAGGISGYMDNAASIANSYNTGDVEAYGYYAGGIIGYMNNSSNQITNCYNLSNVRANGYAGGICGREYRGTISKCFNAGSVTGNSYVGGIYGGIYSANYSNNYVLSGSAANSYGGTFVAADEFASGSVAFQLNNSVNGAATWRQNLSGTVDSLPVLDTAHALVYLSQPCRVVYANSDTTLEHQFDDFGLCTVCGEYMAATLIANAAMADSLGLSDDYVGFYAIENAAHLYWFADLVNNGTNRAAKAVLLADIVVNDNVLTVDGSPIAGADATLRTWTPIGNSSYNYYGTFDGNGHTISGLYFNNTGTSYVGLFGNVSNPTIKNVGLVDSYIKGFQYVGGIAGYISNSAHITNCYNDATVYANGNSSSCAGGICGYLSNSSAVIDSCYNTGYVSGYYQYVGGICGNQNYGTITNSYNAGKVYSNAGNSTGSSTYVGGITGYMNYTASIANCYNTGDVESYGYRVGGIVGQMNNSGNQVTNCYNLGNIKAKGNAGGISGYLYVGTIANNYNNGEVEATNGNAGGISGGQDYGTITNSYNSGSVKTTNSYAGGVTGYVNYSTAQITNCYNVGTVTSNSYASGITGNKNGFTAYNYALRGTATECYGGSFATAEEFANGLVAYGLNGRSSENVVWFQTIGTDSLPVWDTTHAVVYATAPCDVICSNTPGGVKEHATCNALGQCPDCGKYLATPLFVATAGIADSLGLSGNYVGFYAIENTAQLYWFANEVNGGATNAKAVLLDNIVVNDDVLTEDGSLNGDGSSFAVWTPIGNNNRQYAGTFDGNGHTISGLYFNDEYADYVGLFGYVSYPTIKNVSIEDSYIEGRQYVAGIAGYIYSSAQISNCHNAATIYSAYTDYNYVGGIAGNVEGSSAVIDSCTNSGFISAYACYVGGICGRAGNGTVTNSHNSGKIYSNSYNSTTSNAYTGGIAGYMNNSASIRNCYNTADVEGKGNNVGGVVGYMNNSNSQVTNCYNLGNVKAYGYAGGICGYQNYGTITKNYNIGTVTANSCGGGICGYQGYGTITRNYNIGIVTANSNVGGICGYRYSGTVSTNYVLKGTASSSNGGTFVSAAELASGKVAYWLNGSVSGGTTWFQTLGEDARPLFDATHAKVYTSAPCPYSNDTTGVREHSFNEIGLCSVCGSGTQPSLVDGWYEIDNAGKLYWFAQTVNAYADSASIKGRLTADIVVNNSVLNTNGSLNGTPEFEWTPIGSSSITYKGTFDGQGHTISGLYFNNTNTTYVGLFGYTNSATISNVGLVDSYISANQQVGGIVGRMSGNTQIANCYSLATVNSGSYSGGLCGYQENGTISNSYFAGTLLSSGNYIYGISGYNAGTIAKCYVLTGSASLANTGASFRTATEFASGSVAHLLNDTVDGGSLWRQTLSVDAFPVLDTASGKVYASAPCPFSNDTTGVQQHHFGADGFCIYCHATTAPSLVDGWYEIENAGHLMWFAQQVNTYADSAAIKGKLMADIVLNSNVLAEDGTLNGNPAVEWTPIGTSSIKYVGTFDGQGHTISGLYFSNTNNGNYPNGGNNVGLFGFVSGGTICNVGVVDSYFKGYYYVGGIVGKLYEGTSTISNCFNEASIYTTNGTYAFAGGIAGHAYGSASTITNCYNKGKINGSGQYTGGICGILENSASLSSCFNIGNVTSTTTSYLASIAPRWNDAGAITNSCYLAGTSSVAGNGTSVTAEEFANGRVAYLLNGSKSDSTVVWRQNIGTDLLPIADSTHSIVYYASPCPVYSNVAEKEHGTCNALGLCPDCGHYLTAPLYVATSAIADSLGLAEDYVGYYAIENAAHLYWYAEKVNTGSNGIKGVLLNNITVNSNVLNDEGELNGTPEFTWTPISNNSYNYYGTFDGQGHTISGLYFNDTDKSYVGLFGYINYPTIKNVGLVDSYFKGYQYVGGIVGYVNNAAKIINCYNEATVYASCQNSYAGGICGRLGYSTAVIDGCHNTGYVSGYYQYVGGICGYQNNGTITNSYNAGKVYSSAGNSTGNYAYTGGISGYMVNSASIENCYNSGDVETYGYRAGGITGYIDNQNNKIAGCYNVGRVSARNYAGGITAYLKGVTINNFALSGTAANCDGGQFATAEEFASGKVTFALNNSIADSSVVWFQTLGTDSLPVLDNTHGIVYAAEPCHSAFANSAVGGKPHTFDTFGQCTVCGEYEPATFVADAAVADSLGLDESYVGFYAIDRAAQLYWFAEQVNSGSTEINGVLLNNIVVNDSVLTEEGVLKGTPARTWSPIGTNSFSYAGTFDGNGYTISGLYFNDVKASYVGLFGYVNNPTIANVGVVDSYFKGCQYMGGIVGFISSSAKITNCFNAATIHANNSGDCDAGGICGYMGNSTVIDGCYNIGFITVYLQVAGGICGYQNNGTITNCYNTGKVHSSAGNSTGNNAFAGGISGYMTNSASIANCYNTGDVDGYGNYVGGIAGYMYNSSNQVTNSYNLGSVKANQYAGGISGYQRYGTTSNCYNAGAITANSYARGISGYWISGSRINCYVLSGSASDNGGGTFATADDFASGLIAYQLNGSENNGAVWHQNLNSPVDSLPVLDKTHAPVWMGCDSVFVNDMADAPHHFVDGVCSVCGVKEFPMLVDGWYEIENQYQLYWFAEQVNSGSTSIKAKLVADIVVNDSVLDAEGNLYGPDSLYKAWTPIGTNSYKFAGTFDGQGHTISGLYFKNTNNSDYPSGGRQIGLIGYSNGATIKNVGVVDSYLYGYYRVAGICGYSNGGTITNCFNASTINALGNVAAGIFGEGNNCTITACYNQGLINGVSFVAGIAAYNTNGAVTNCYTAGTIKGTGSSVGGIYGSYNGTASNCYILNGTVSSSIANGGTFATADDFVGGKVAYSLTGGDTLAPVWFQTLFADGMPVLDTNRNVVAGYVETVGDEIIVHGNLVVATDYVIAEGKTLVVPAGTTLTTTDSAVITNNGTLVVDGTLAAASVEGSGDFVYRDITDDEVALTTTSVTYNGSEFTLADGLEVEYLTRTAFGKTLTFDAENAAVSYSANRNVGTATVVWTVSDAVTISREFTIEPRSLTITVDSTANKAYDGTTVATGRISSNKLSSDDLTVNYEAAFADANAANGIEVVYSFSISGTDAANYVLTTTTDTTVANIEPATGVVVTITGKKRVVVYSGNEQSAAGYSASFNTALYSANDFTFSGVDTVKATNAGTYAMQLADSLFSNTNANFADVTFAVTDGSLIISKATTAPNKPQTTMETRYVNTQLVELPDGWRWNEYRALVLGTNKDTAIYVGADAGNYNIERAVVTITRLACLHNAGSDTLYSLAPTCSHAGYTGNYCCMLCGEIYAYGDSIPALDHKPDSIVIENYVAATYTTAGSYDSVVYCSVGHEELSRTTIEIPMLEPETIEAEVVISQVEYTVGDSLNVDGGKLVVAVGDSASVEIAITPDMIKDFNPDSVGVQTVVIEFVIDSVIYRTTIEITVKPTEQPVVAQSIKITKPTKVEYKKGEQLDVKGGKLTVTFSDGTTKDVALAANMVSGFDANKIGEQKLTVTYTDGRIKLTATFTIEVVDDGTAIADVAADKVSIFAINRTIVVETAEPSDEFIHVFDANGRLVAKELATSNRTEIKMTRQGLYIVRMGNKAERVVLY